MEQKLSINNFIFKNVLGKGSFGSVYKATYIKEKNTVAVKKIRDDDQVRKAALKEIEILKFLGQFEYEIPFIKYLGDFKENNIQFIVFELLDINLYEFYTKYYYQIDFSFLYNFIFNLCLGLTFLHKRYIHADLKPENIMYDRRTKIFKIIDLGSSFDKDKVFKKPYIQSRYYRAPEILFGYTFNETIDIWSLGCIIIELIINKPIFNGNNKRDMIFKICQFIDIPKLYKNEIFFNKYFCIKISDVIEDKNEDVDYLHNNFTKNKKYKEPKFRLSEYITNYLIFLSGEHEKKNQLKTLIIDMLNYDISKRPTAEKCLEYKLFQ
jgi:serine/threonine protein kinase